MQNVPPWAEEFVHPPEGYGLVAFDYSQIEYRMFAHYTAGIDDRIMRAYIDDPTMDYHGWFAEILGVHRQFAKQLNFSFLFGMGKKKLLKVLSAMLMASKDPGMVEHMRMLAYGAGTAIAERASRMDASAEMEILARHVFDDYHKKFPAIEKFSKMVGTAQRKRKQIYNVFGRVYHFPFVIAHKGVNYLCQGSASDYVKDRLVAVMQEVAPKYGATLLTSVHDSIVNFVPLEGIVDFYLEAEKVLTAGRELRVPILVAGKIGSKSWARLVELGMNATREQVEEGLRAADQIPARDYYGNQKALRASGRVMGT